MSKRSFLRSSKVVDWGCLDVFFTGTDSWTCSRLKRECLHSFCLYLLFFVFLLLVEAVCLLVFTTILYTSFLIIGLRSHGAESNLIHWNDWCTVVSWLRPLRQMLILLTFSKYTRCLYMKQNNQKFPIVQVHTWYGSGSNRTMYKADAATLSV